MNKSTDYSDMQGPCPTGYHVPTYDEWSALCGILTSTFGMAGNATTMGTYLKMPMAGYRFNSNASVNYVGSRSGYWSSTPRSASSTYTLYFDTSSIHPEYDYSRSNAYSVRGFKDVPTVPTSSWTTLYQGTGGAGVFYNATDGLISVSGDGTTWYTIMDKNLGATIVYNQGDTSTDANCGYFYQRGNNYGFTHSGTVTTSSTKVDASNYGPGNYYSSSTFIIGSGDWSSVQNDNLWGGVSGIGGEKEPKKIYIRVNEPLSYSDFDFLLVGGGGAGGGSGNACKPGGGGGAGGLIECCNYEIQPGSYSITIGAGGIGVSAGAGGNGGDSCFNGLTAYGGGGGGQAYGYGCNGGSGGGGGSNAVYRGGDGCSGQGNNGGCGCIYGGGGGGGACSCSGGIGGNASCRYGGYGGLGKCICISGTYQWYAGGGGGGSCLNNEHSLSNGGSCSRYLDATIYGGGGGGGQYNCSSNYCGYNGCQGVFIFRYPTACGYSVSGGTCYTCGDYTIHCFTSDGTLTIN